MFKLYFSLNQFKLRKSNSHLSYSWRNLYKQSCENFNSTKTLFSFFCNCNCNCNKFKLWKPHAHVLTQYSRTKITLLFFFHAVRKTGLKMYPRVCHWGHLKALANEDTLLPTKIFPRLPARAAFVADTNTKNVSDFVQKHFVYATNVSQFAQPKKHHGQQCVRSNVSSFTRALRVSVFRINECL